MTGSRTTGFSVRARLLSFQPAGRGFATLLRSQHNAWVHAFATVLVVALGLMVELERVEWLALVFAIVSVWAAEALNTAVEFLCDVVCPDLHPLVACAKDVAAAAVLICAAGALLVAALVFGPRFRGGEGTGHPQGLERAAGGRE